MRTYLVLLCMVLLPALPAAAEDDVGAVRPVAMDLTDTGLLRIFGTGVHGEGFTKPDADSGTVHSGAVMATIRQGDAAIAVAIDADDPDAQGANVVRLDLSGRGQFQDAPTLPLRHGQFGPAVVEAQLDGRTWPVWVEGRYARFDTDRRFLRLGLGMALEGQARFGERVLPFRILDASRQNGRVGDVADAPWTGVTTRNEERGDLVVVNPHPDQPWRYGINEIAFAYYGTPIQVDGAWYDVTLNDDKTRVAVTPSEVAMGAIQVDHFNWNATLVGEKYVLRLTAADEKPIEVPADTYVLVGYAEMSRPIGPQRQEHTLYFGHADLAERRHAVEVPRGQTAQVRIGSPVTVRFTTEQSGTMVRFEADVRDAAGRSVNPPGGGGAPSFIVRDAQERIVHTGQMAYG